MRYADLAGAIRHFTSRIVGPSLDLMGTSLELLRYDGLIEALDGTGMEDNAVLTVTSAGKKEFETLMRSNIRAPSSDDLNKLIITLKLRFLHLLGPSGPAGPDRSARRLVRDGTCPAPGSAPPS